MMPPTNWGSLSLGGLSFCDSSAGMRNEADPRHPKIEVIWLPPLCRDTVSTSSQHYYPLRSSRRHQFPSSLLVTPSKFLQRVLSASARPQSSQRGRAPLRQSNPLHELYLVHSPRCRLKGEKSTPSPCLPTPSNPCPSPYLPLTDPSAHIYGPSSREPFLRSKATRLKTSAFKPAKPHCQL